MASKFSTPGITEENHDALHEWKWDGVVRGIPGAALNTSRIAVYGDAQNHQIEEAKKGNLINVRVERFDEDPKSGDFRWGIFSQPAYCSLCERSTWMAPNRMTVTTSGTTGTQRPMAPQEIYLHAKLKTNPELVPSEEEGRQERRYWKRNRG